MVHRVVAVIMLMVVTTAACTSPPPPESTTTTTLGGASSPEEALRELFGAIENQNYGATATLTFDDQLALLVSLEGFQVDETNVMLADGVPPAVRDNFWKSFSAGFPVFAEEELAGVLIGSGETFSVEGQAFATVEVALRRSTGSGDWIARRDAQGRWRLDLFATFGPSFATPLRGWLAGLGTDPEAAIARQALADQRPSLLAALQRQPFGPIGPETMAEVDDLLFETDL